MNNCPNCGAPVSGRFCDKCGSSVIPPQGQDPSQQPPMTSQQPPMMPQYPQMNLANIAVILLLIGAIFLSTGVFFLAFAPDEITVGEPDIDGSEVTFGFEMTAYKIGVILLGVGVLIERIASTLATKEHFRRLDNLGTRR